MNHLAYANQLNHRFKKILFIFEGNNYERSKNLAYLVSNRFPNYGYLVCKIEEYIDYIKNLALNEAPYSTKKLINSNI